jgi:hypothetical protein
MQPQAFFSDETWPCEKTNTNPKGKRVLKKDQPKQTYYFQEIENIMKKIKFQQMLY